MYQWSDIITLRMKRQFFSTPVNKENYNELFNNMSPVPTMYWTAPGDPPTLPPHSDFNDYDYNSIRRSRREILKGRFGGGSIAYVTKEDLELFGCLYRKELSFPSSIQDELLELLTQEGPMNIGMMKELTGLLVKEITPALHKLQEAFLVYEDQLDNEGDRGWYLFESEFPEIDLNRYSRLEALKLVIPRFAYLCVFFEDDNLKSYYKLPQKLVKEAANELVKDNVLQTVTLEGRSGYVLCGESNSSSNEISVTSIPPILLLQRNDFMVRSYAEKLKETFQSEWETLYYLLINGEFHGAVVGRFKFGPHVIEDIVIDLPKKEKDTRRDEIMEAVYQVFDRTESPMKRYDGRFLI